MRTAALLALALSTVVACGTATPPEEVVVTITFPVTTTTVTAPTTTGLPACDLPALVPAVLPERVATDRPEPGTVAIDRFTARPGTAVRMWSDERGEPVVVLVRGALPPEPWAGEPVPFPIRGVEGALGPLSEGVWAAAWFEGPERCDDYTLVLYPPTGEEEVREVAASLVEVPDP